MAKRQTGTMNLDLHGFTVTDAIAAFKKTYATALPTKKEIDVIHGYSSSGTGGSISDILRRFLRRQESQGVLTWYPGETIDNNPGHTIVFPIAAIQDRSSDLSDRIMEFCQQPRKLAALRKKFFRVGDAELEQTLASLCKSGILQKEKDGREFRYIVSGEG